MKFQKDNLYAVLMAGGWGERLWPLSRKERPKQFLPLGTPRTLIRETYRRIGRLVPPERILIITNKEQAKLVAGHLPELPRRNIIIEPAGRSTAACLGLAAVHVPEKDAILIALPSDHIIKNEGLFRKDVLSAVNFAESGDYLVTLGIKPTYPACGYGYIKVGRKERAGGIFKVDKFVEKPALKTAERYLKSGKFLWNGGIFVFKVSSILSAFKRYMPELYRGLEKIRERRGKGDYFKILSGIYRKLPKVSIDYGVMEKSYNVYVRRAEFDWDDVGSWEALRRIIKPDKDGNVSMGKVFSIDTHGSILVSEEGHLLAALGLSDTIVVHTPTATLVCPRAYAGSIKSFLGKLC